MWNAFQVFNLSHVLSRVKQKVHYCLMNVSGSIGMGVPSKADSSHWDFGFPVFLLLDCNYSCTVLLHTCLYRCVCQLQWWDKWRYLGVWVPHFCQHHVKVANLGADCAPCFKSMPSVDKDLVTPQIRWHSRTHSLAPGYCRTNKTVDAHCKWLPLAVVYRTSQRNPYIKP